jgi:hypothetical protein
MWGKPTDLKLCQAITLLIRLNIGPTNGKKATLSLAYPPVDLHARGG